MSWTNFTPPPPHAANDRSLRKGPHVHLRDLPYLGGCPSSTTHQNSSMESCFKAQYDTIPEWLNGTTSESTHCISHCFHSLAFFAILHGHLTPSGVFRWSLISTFAITSITHLNEPTLHLMQKDFVMFVDKQHHPTPLLSKYAPNEFCMYFGTLGLTLCAA